MAEQPRLPQWQKSLGKHIPLAISLFIAFYLLLYVVDPRTRQLAVHTLSFELQMLTLFLFFAISIYGLGAARSRGRRQQDPDAFYLFSLRNDAHNLTDRLAVNPNERDLKHLEEVFDRFKRVVDERAGSKGSAT